MQIIQHPDIPAPKGHYSPCIEHNGTLYISGQLPRDPQTDEIPEGIDAQTRQVLDNLMTILEAAGSGLQKLLSVRIYVSNITYWEEVNIIYTQYLRDHRPARCVVPTRDLHYGCLIEVEAIAAQ